MCSTRTLEWTYNMSWALLAERSKYICTGLQLASMHALPFAIASHSNP